jgi:hypothetical protein
MAVWDCGVWAVVIESFVCFIASSITYARQNASTHARPHAHTYASVHVHTHIHIYAHIRAHSHASVHQIKSSAACNFTPAILHLQFYICNFTPALLHLQFYTCTVYKHLHGGTAMHSRILVHVQIAQYTEEEEKHTIEGLPLDKQARLNCLQSTCLLQSCCLCIVQCVNCKFGINCW